MDLNLLKHAQNYIEKMAKGINPLTEETIPDNELLNNIRISRCLFYVNDVLKEVINNKGIKYNKNNKQPFCLTQEQLNKYQYEEYDLRITEIARKLNELNDNGETKKLSVSNVTKWLMSLGLLEETIIDNNRKSKIPTKEGIEMGIYTEKRYNVYNREYTTVLYKKEIQQFIIDNFSELLEHIKNN